jgi:hypothetical protein
MLHQQVRKDLNMNNPVQAAGTARGGKTSSSFSQLRQELNSYGARRKGGYFFTPCYACGLHGVINIERLRRYFKSLDDFM